MREAIEALRRRTRRHGCRGRVSISPALRHGWLANFKKESPSRGGAFGVLRLPHVLEPHPTLAILAEP